MKKSLKNLRMKESNSFLFQNFLLMSMTIQEKIEIIYPHKFKARNYQIDAWKALDSEKKRIVCAWHRGAGKDLFALNYLIWRALEKPAVYLHCFPKYNQGKRAIWNSVHQTDEGEAMAYLDHFPKEIVK